MLTINRNPPDFVARAVGVVAGTLRPDPQNGPTSIILSTKDGAEIPGVIQKQAAKKIMQNPVLMTQPLECLVYPRTEKRLLKLIVVDLEPTDLKKKNPDRDNFLIQGMNIGSRLNNIVQIALRPNKNAIHQYERFWICLNGHLKDEQRCIYQIQAIRRGRKLFIMESVPKLQKRCTPVQRPRDHQSGVNSKAIIHRHRSH